MKVYRQKQRIYDITNPSKWRYIGLRNVYIHDNAMTYVKYNNRYTPANRLTDDKGVIYVITADSKYTVKK
jgi:hypothetical protein